MFGRTDLNELKELIFDIEKYIENNTDKLILGKVYMNFLFMFVSVLKLSIAIINRYKVLTEIKLTKRMLSKNQYKKGDLFIVKEPILVLKTFATAEEAAVNRKKDKGSWHAVNVNDVVMFVDTIYDDYYDCVFFQILKENSIFLVMREENTKNFIDFINKKFTKISYEQHNKAAI